MSLPSSSSGSNEKSSRDVAEEQDVDEDDEEEFFEAETLPIIGRCNALYPFEGTLSKNNDIPCYYID